MGLELQTAGGYELREKVHSSPSGTLYRGFHPLLGREALVKLMPADALSHPEVLKRFQREIRLLAQLTHPNLMAALHAGVELGVHYLVLENVPGIDLQTKVVREGPLAMEAAVDAVCQAAEGLAFLHEKGIIHRNVKPSNLMIDPVGVVRVTNLTAALVGADATVVMDDEDLTREGQVLGTAEFLAPEQAFDSHSVDARSDIYSLGCTLYFLLCGQVPYPGAEGGHRKATAHVQRPIPSLRDTHPEISPEVDAVFQKMLAKMPVDRYQSMPDVITDLRRAAQGLAPQQAQAIGRNHLGLIVAAAILGVGIGAIAIVLVQRLLFAS